MRQLTLVLIEPVDDHLCECGAKAVELGPGEELVIPQTAALFCQLCGAWLDTDDPPPFDAGAKDQAAWIRQRLRQLGWTSRHVSIRSGRATYDGTITVVIKDAAVDARAVDDVAKLFKRIRRDQFGEILGGGNCWVRVSLADSITAPLTLRIRPQLEEIDAQRESPFGDPVALVALPGLDVCCTDDPCEGCFSIYHGEDFVGVSEGVCHTAKVIAEYAVWHQLDQQPTTAARPKAEAAQATVAEACGFQPTDVVSVYTRQQALEDGTVLSLRDRTALEDLSPSNGQAALDLVIETFLGSDSDGIPVAITRTLAHTIQTACANRRCHNDLVGVLHDIFWMAFRGQFNRFARRAATEGSFEHAFEVKITGTGRRQNFTLCVALDGDGVTFMFPEES